jgi:hypothetical protein
MRVTCSLGLARIAREAGRKPIRTSPLLCPIQAVFGVRAIANCEVAETIRSIYPTRMGKKDAGVPRKTQVHWPSKAVQALVRIMLGIIEESGKQMTNDKVVMSTATARVAEARAALECRGGKPGTPGAAGPQCTPMKRWPPSGRTHGPWQRRSTPGSRHSSLGCAAVANKSCRLVTCPPVVLRTAGSPAQGGD